MSVTWGGGKARSTWRFGRRNRATAPLLPTPPGRPAEADEARAGGRGAAAPRRDLVGASSWA